MLNILITGANRGIGFELTKDIKCRINVESIPPEKETVIFFSQSFLTALSIACPISESLSLLTLKYWIR